MNLSPEQKQAVSSWIADGQSIAQVQKRLEEEFDLSITYMDARFLIDDLNLEIQDQKPKPSPTADLSAQAAPPPAPATDQPAGEAPAEAPVGGNVSVELDKLTRPGTVVSGDVTFSDGITAKWALDQQGRLMLEAAQEDYQPSKDDLTAFQAELSQKLQSKGY
ncbi:MAG: hypothetical protein JKY51_05525 [Opitutaceae bacterium]|nr:hypothetical protein [Opitutaceae bacterium]